MKRGGRLWMRANGLRCDVYDHIACEDGSKM